MLPWILAAFIAVPVAEIAVFIEAGERWGLWPTIGAIFGTAILGSLLIRQQGLAVLREVQGEMDAGRFPALQVFDGLCLLIAGALLLTPGFITDGIGFLLLVPWARRGAAGLVLARLDVRMASAGPTGGPYAGGDIIDGDYADVTDPDRPPRDEPTPPKALR